MQRREKERRRLRESKRVAPHLSTRGSFLEQLVVFLIQTIVKKDIKPQSLYLAKHCRQPDSLHNDEERHILPYQKQEKQHDTIDTH